MSIKNYFSRCKSKVSVAAYQSGIIKNRKFRCVKSVQHVLRIMVLPINLFYVYKDHRSAEADDWSFPDAFSRRPVKRSRKIKVIVRRA